MAQPKRRWSKQRTHLRRSTWKLEPMNLSVCSNCKEKVLSHIACPNCGYYNNKPAVEIKSKEEKTEKKEKTTK
ncbi:MAG: 50S ribosomal protein L32 [Clostridia bacterium]